MSIYNFSIDLNKIPEEKIKTKDKDGNLFKNGAKYVDLTLFVNDKPDNYGNNLKCVISQPKDSNEDRIYVGNGKFKTKD